VPDIIRYGDGTVLETPDGDIRALYFDVPNLTDNHCQDRTKYVLNEKDGDQSKLDGILVNNSLTGEI